MLEIREILFQQISLSLPAAVHPASFQVSTYFRPTNFSKDSYLQLTNFLLSFPATNLLSSLLPRHELHADRQLLAISNFEFEFRSNRLPNWNFQSLECSQSQKDHPLSTNTPLTVEHLANLKIFSSLPPPTYFSGKLPVWLLATSSRCFFAPLLLIASSHRFFSPLLVAFGFLAPVRASGGE